MLGTVARMTAPKPKKPSPTAPQGASAVESSRKAIDWDALSPHYRAGIRSLKDIGNEFDVSDAAIIKHARKEGWTRDLKGKVKAKADAKVSAAMVSAEVSTQTKITEKLTIEVESTVQARIRLAHRTDVGRSRTLAMRLLEELEIQTSQILGLEDLGKMMYAPDKNGVDKLNELYQKVISLPGRTKTMKDLGDTLKTLIGLERQAFGLDDAPPSSNDPLTTMLQRIASSNSSAFLPVQNDPAHAED